MISGSSPRRCSTVPSGCSSRALCGGVPSSVQRDGAVASPRVGMPRSTSPPGTRSSRRSRPSRCSRRSRSPSAPISRPAARAASTRVHSSGPSTSSGTPGRSERRHRSRVRSTFCWAGGSRAMPSPMASHSRERRQVPARVRRQGRSTSEGPSANGEAASSENTRPVTTAGAGRLGAVGVAAESGSGPSRSGIMRQDRRKRFSIRERSAAERCRQRWPPQVQRSPLRTKNRWSRSTLVPSGKSKRRSAPSPAPRSGT